MSLTISKIDDTRKRFQNTFAVSYGPLVLAGVPGTLASSFNTTLVGDLDNPDSWITRDSSDKLSFTAVGKGRTIKLIPLGYTVDEPYIVYFDASPAPTLYSIQSAAGGSPLFIRHAGNDMYNNMLYLTPVNAGDQTQQQQSTWITVEGLASNDLLGPSADPLVSFAAFHFDAGFYIIHNARDTSWSTQTATAGPYPWPQDFRGKSSFYVRAGLQNLVVDGSSSDGAFAGAATVSFESYDLPGYYLTTYNQTSPCSPSQCNGLCGFSTCTAVHVRPLVNSQEYRQKSTFVLSPPNWRQ